MAKNHAIKFKVTAEELRTIKGKAKDLGLTVSALCRLVALKIRTQEIDL